MNIQERIRRAKRVQDDLITIEELHSKMEYDAEIREYRFHTSGNGSLIVDGNIYNDSKGRFRDGSKMHTSRVYSFNRETGIVVTKNSIYKLVK